jgi:hypothetical protein
MINEKIRQHVLSFLEKEALEHGWDFDKTKKTDNDIIATIKDFEIWKDGGDRHRHYFSYFKVAEIDNMLIGYNDKESTDEDFDFDFDKSSICEVEEREITIKTYIPIKQ